MADESYLMNPLKSPTENSFTETLEEKRKQFNRAVGTNEPLLIIFDLVAKGEANDLENALSNLSEENKSLCGSIPRHMANMVSSNNIIMMLADLALKKGNQKVIDILYENCLQVNFGSTPDIVFVKLIFNHKNEIDNWIADYKPSSNKKDFKSPENDYVAGMGIIYAAQTGCLYALQKLIEAKETHQETISPTELYKAYSMAWEYKEIREYLDKKYPTMNLRHHTLEILMRSNGNYFHDYFPDLQCFIQEDLSLLNKPFSDEKTPEVLAMHLKKYPLAKYLCAKMDEAKMSAPGHFYDSQYWRDKGISEENIVEPFKKAIQSNNLDEVKSFIAKNPNLLERKIFSDDRSITLFAMACKSYEVAEYLVQEDAARNQGKNNQSSFLLFKSAYQQQQSSQNFGQKFLNFFSSMDSGINTGGYKEMTHVLTNLKNTGHNHDATTKSVLDKWSYG